MGLKKLPIPAASDPITTKQTMINTSSESAQGYALDARNESVLVYVNGEFFPGAKPESRCLTAALHLVMVCGRVCA